MAKICLYCARFENESFGLAPLGVGYLFSSLVHHGPASGDDIRVVDTLDEAIGFQPDILGVGSVSQVISDATRFAAACREACRCITVLGGYHVTCLPQKLPPEFDIGVLGEGEQTFCELVERYIAGDIEASLKDIKGICWRDGGEIVVNPRREIIDDIDAIPWPQRHQKYSKDEPIFTSRGCPYNCTFCASHTFWEDKFRLRSAESVIDEIAHIVETRKPDEIAIIDDLWMADKKRLLKIVEGLERRGIPQQVTFRGFCRSNMVYEQDILLLKRLDYRFVRFGAETGSQKLLTKIKGPGITVKDHQRVINLCDKHGLRCGASFMFGLPGETKKDLRKTIKFLRRNSGKCVVMGFYLFNPIPGTILWNELLKQKKLDDDLDLTSLQLDMTKPSFDWNRVLYFNQDNIDIDEFRDIVESIRSEFISPPQ